MTADILTPCTIRGTTFEKGGQNYGNIRTIREVNGAVNENFDSVC